MIKAVFFDLDGTLVPCDTDEFVKGYYKLLIKYLMKTDIKLDISYEELPVFIYKACEAVFKNDGSKTNRELFWEAFFRLCKLDDDSKEAFIKACDHFYKNEFEEAKSLLSELDPDIPLVFDLLDDHHIIKVLATSPVFPRAATEKRITWVHKRYSDFEHVTTYENSIYCKPDLRYYKELLDLFALKADEVLMVGNDIREDMRPALALGMKTFLIERFILHDDGSYTGPKGDFKDLARYLKEVEGL